MHNYESFLCKRCFLTCYLKWKVAEDVMQSGLDDHAFGQASVREHFPEEVLTLRQNRLLGVDIRLDWVWTELIEVKKPWKLFGSNLLQ